MTDPAIVTCTKDTWVKVATNVTKCRVDVRLTGPKYAYTYVDTGHAAPTGVTFAIPVSGGHFIIDIVTAADIYVLAQGLAGSVQVNYGLIA